MSSAAGKIREGTRQSLQVSGACMASGSVVKRAFDLAQLTSGATEGHFIEFRRGSARAALVVGAP